jgi:hypothetical protein
MIAWLPGAWQRHTPTPARRDSCRLRHSAIASSICSSQALGGFVEGRDDVFPVPDQVPELAAGEDQFEIGVPAELLPMPGAVRSKVSSRILASGCFHFRGNGVIRLIAAMLPISAAFRL